MVHVAVLGAGPTGLEAALAAHGRGWDVTVYETEPHVGGYVRRWGELVVREITVVDRSWSGRRVLLVCAGNSAQTAVRDLVAAGADLTWVVRRDSPTGATSTATPCPTEPLSSPPPARSRPPVRSVPVSS